MHKKNLYQINFNKGVDKYWNQLVTGGGIIKIENSCVKLGFNNASKDQYTDAQLDDYTMFPRSKYPWKAPLKMSVKARFLFNNKKSVKIPFQGTAGFGFWNNPFSVYGGKYSLPESNWFFFNSPNSNMLLKRNTKGFGWKAQTIHSMKLSNVLYFIPTSIAVLIGKITGNSKLSQYWIEKFSGVEEVDLNINMQNWHMYELIWKKNKTEFFVDGKKVMVSKNSPTRPVGFVAWVDNQFAMVSPKDIVKFGTSNSGPLFLEIALIHIESLIK